MLLQFVSEPNIGPKERRLIRSHVMKGKNAGKRRPARNQLFHRSKDHPVLSTDHDPDDDQLHTKHTLSLPRLLWNELSLTSYPCHTSPGIDKFVFQHLRIISTALYPSAFCTELNLSQYAWFQYILEDAAHFHSILAITSSFPTHFGGAREITPNALHHISQAYRLTNERLSGPEACSDKAVAVVCMLAVYQRMHHQHAVGLVHFEGLRRMINLRGGLAKMMHENRAVGQKPWRLALEFALQDGGPVRFGVDEIEGLEWGEGVLASRSGGDCDRARKLELIDPVLLAHFESIGYLMDRLNTDSSKVDPLDYSDAISLRLHRLLVYAPLSPDRRSDLAPLDNLVHLTLVAVMTTLMPEYGHNQARYALLGGQMRNALQIYAKEKDRNCEIVLWALFVGYATIISIGRDEAWLVALAADMCGQLTLHDWRSVGGMLRRYAWISIYYDKAGLVLFSQIKERRSMKAM